MSRLKVITLLLFLTFVKANAQESIEPLTQKVLTPYASITNFNSSVWKNPAIKYKMMNSNLSTVYVKGDLENRDNAFLVEQGYNDKSINIGADSYTHLNEKVKVYGSAYYEQNHNNMMVWNNNIDYSLIYPYVTADSIGGDMQSKRYFFNGGYTQQFGKWNVGGEVSYRVAIAYRDKDPRPRNIVSDFNAKVAASRAINNYIAGLSLGVRSYNQNSDISYYADKGKTSVYHMLGLGTDYVRFGGNYDDTDFKGYGILSSIDLIPREKYGFKLSLKGNYLDLTKYISNLNNAPVNEIHEFEVATTLSWLSTFKKFEYGAKINGGFVNRQGQENILGDALAGVYPVISQQTPFLANSLYGCATLLFGSDILANKWGWRVTPSIAYSNLEQSYNMHSRFYNITNITPQINALSTLQMKRCVLKLSAAYSTRANIKLNYSLNGLKDGSSIKGVQLKNISYLSDDYNRFNCELGADYLLTPKYILALSLDYKHMSYAALGKINLMQAKLAFKF